MDAVKEVILVVGHVTVGTDGRAVSVLSFLCLSGEQAMGPLKCKKESVCIASEAGMIGLHVHERVSFIGPMIGVLYLEKQGGNRASCTNPGAVVVGDSRAGNVKVNMGVFVQGDLWN